jgi:hypothetical protein
MMREWLEIGKKARGYWRDFVGLRVYLKNFG